MRNVFTARDFQRLSKEGKGPADIPPGAVLTPSARDAIREWQHSAAKDAPPPAPAAVAATNGAAQAVVSAPQVMDNVVRWKPGQDPASVEAMDAYLNSPAIAGLRESMAQAFRSLGQRAWADGGSAKLAVRVADTFVLASPDLRSPALVNAADFTFASLPGTSIPGVRQPVDFLASALHILRHQPEAKTVLFATPPYATAMAIAKVRPPACAVAQAEVVVGEIGLAEGLLPDAADFTDRLGELARQHMAILIPYQGVLVWGGHLDEALIRLEQTETVCRSLALAGAMGGQLEPMPGATVKSLLKQRENLGIKDRRMGLKECELCDSGEFRPGVVCRPAGGSESAEALVKQLTNEIIQRLNGKG